jgi:dihydrofolate reductase
MVSHLEARAPWRKDPDAGIPFSHSEGEIVATVFIHKVMSLDGFISKPDEMDNAWMFAYGSGGEMPNRMMGEVGAVIQGNKGFRDGTMSEDTLPYGGLKAAQFIVTHDARDPVELGGLTFNFVTDGIERAVELAREAAGDKRVALLGASIAQQCLKAGLVDEIVMHLAPVILGDGISLFDHLGTEIELRREEVDVTDQVTSLRFSVVSRTG